MNNFMMSMKRFFSNKNVVTIIGVVIVLALLYWEYNSKITKAVNPTRVPVAASDLLPQQEITSSDLNWIDVPSVSKDSNALTNSSSIVGKYVGVNSMIPKGSMFYKTALVDKEDLPGNWLTELKEDEIPAYIKVDIVTTYSNSIEPGDYVDVWMKAEDEEGLVMFGKLIENIKIIAVKDSNGQDVFKSSNEVGTPAYLYYGLESDYFVMLVKAPYIDGVELAIVPHGGAVPKMGDVEVASDYLRDYIDASTLAIPENEDNGIDVTDKDKKDKEDKKENN